MSDKPICPFNGRACPGVEHCRPAARYRSDGTVDYACPISLVVSTAEMLVATIVSSFPMEEPPQEKNVALQALARADQGG